MYSGSFSRRYSRNSDTDTDPDPYVISDANSGTSCFTFTLEPQLRLSSGGYYESCENGHRGQYGERAACYRQHYHYRRFRAEA